MSIKNFLQKKMVYPSCQNSRPPTTNGYDKQSYVMVASRSDDILKFMKMHLNRYFSHVVVCKKLSECLVSFKERKFDLLITELSSSPRQNTIFLKRVSLLDNSLPVILIQQNSNDKDFLKFPFLVMVDLISEPFDLDLMHMAIRRSLNIRGELKELSLLMPKKLNFIEVLDGSLSDIHHGKTAELIKLIRIKLDEKFVD